jgi:hypothetical protein
MLAELKYASWTSMIGNGQGETEIPVDHYLSWMSTKLPVCHQPFGSTANPFYCQQKIRPT